MEIYSPPTIQRISDQGQCAKMTEAHNTADIPQPHMEITETVYSKMTQ